MRARAVGATLDVWGPSHDCGHRCCPMRDNPYHSHIHTPEECLACRAMDEAGDT